MKASSVLFDLDGTVLNTNDLVLESLRHTIRAGYHCFSGEEPILCQEHNMIPERRDVWCPDW